jgi:hypothetical protein
MIVLFTFDIIYPFLEETYGNITAMLSYGINSLLPFPGLVCEISFGIYLGLKYTHNVI